MLVTAIIVSDTKTHKIDQMVNKTIDSLIKSEPDIDFKIVTVEKQKSYNISYYHDIYIKQDTPFNYNHCLNQGLEQSEGDLYILMNNDIIFYDGWLSEIIKQFNKNQKLASVSPASTDQLNLLKDIEQDIVFGWEVRKHIAGFCIVVKPSVIEKIGKLEEDVDFWYSDNAYAQQLMSNDILHGICKKSKVLHLESETLKTLPQNKIRYYTSTQLAKYKKVVEKYKEKRRKRHVFKNKK